MKIGIFTALFHDRSIEEALDTIAAAGIQAVEIGAGAYPGARHLADVGGVDKLIQDEGARRRLRKMIEDRGLVLDSLSVHGNPLHPNAAIAEEHHQAFQNGVLLAEKLDLHVVNGFSGCPGEIQGRGIQIGLRVPGGRISGIFSTGSGKNASFLIGGNRTNSSGSTVSSLLSRLTRASWFIILRQS